MFTIMIMFFLCTLYSTTGAEDVCPDGTKLIVYPNRTADCVDCRRCPTGTIITKNCSDDHDIECTKCYRSAQLGDVGNTCNSCGVCDPGSYRQKNCTKFNDTICSLCPNGTFSATQNVERCSKCDICEPGSYLQKNCTKFQNTVCTPCPNGTFSATQNVDRCSECGNCTGMMITKTECTTSEDVVCKEKEVSLKTADAIAIVAGILEGIVTIIFIVDIIIKYRKMCNKQEVTNHLELQLMLSKKKIQDLKTYTGVLVIDDDETAGKGQENRNQAQPILVLRIGNEYGVTALQSLKRKINSCKGESKADYTKLKAKSVYIEFHKDNNSGDVIKCRVAGNIPVFEDENLDIIVLKITQDESDPNDSHITRVFMHDPLKLIASDHAQESEMQLLDCKTNLSNGNGREYIIKNVSLQNGCNEAIKTLEKVSRITLLKDDGRYKEDMKISINELGRNIYTKNSEHLENISHDLKNIEELKRIISDPIDPKDVTTTFVLGEYSSGCPVFKYDDTGNLQVYCILTHRVPKIFDVLNDDQKLCFTDIQEVTAGTKITAIYKALMKAGMNTVINTMFKPPSNEV